VDILMLSVVFLLGIFVGTFGVVQILIVLLYSIPTNRKLHEVGYLADLKGANRADMLTVGVVGTLTLLVSWLVLRYASSSQQNLYFGVILMVIFMGRKQLRGNDNNTSDYLSSHRRFIDFLEIPPGDAGTRQLVAILQVMPVNIDKEGVGGLLLVYLLGVTIFIMRSGFAVLFCAFIFTDTGYRTALSSANNALLLSLIINMIMHGLIVALGIYLFYCIFTKNSRTPQRAKAFHILIVVTSVVSLILLGFTPELLGGPGSAQGSLDEVIFAVIPAILGTIYFSRSSRVANTFGSPIPRIDSRTATN
jgi:hypothetical protein